MTIGIPRGLFYYYYGDFWKYFFDKLNINYIISPSTNKEIKQLGSKYSTDEMCLSLKNYIGHVAYLSNKCDCILVPRIDNYGYKEQTCTNFLACYDIVNNLFDIDIIDYNISYTEGYTLKKAFISLGKRLGKSYSDSKNAFYYAFYKSKKKSKADIIDNVNKLNMVGKKVLIVSHPYNIYDASIGKNIIKFLEDNGIIIVYSDLFDKKECLNQSLSLSDGIYWKYSREIIGSIPLCIDKVDGVIFLSTFPCGLDSLVNELIIRKLNKKCLNLIIDDLDAFAGIETRLESFIDIV